MNKQLIAAHRGLSSIYPENTLQGLIAALPYCDYVEFDVIANKDLDLLVCHDTFLSRISDIENHPQFSNRKCKRMYKKEMKEDWWICDFTTSEIQSLKLHQSLLTRKSQFDNQLTISLLKDVLLSLLEYNKKNQTNCGVLLEIKDLQFHQENLNIFMAEPIIHLLKTMGLENNQQLPIQIMAFDTPFLLYAKQHCPYLPRVQLIRIEDLGYETKIVKEIAEYANSIGVNLKLLWNKENQCKSQLCNEAKQLGLLIYGWTFQDDNEEILKYFQVKTPKEVYEIFSFLDGIITEFPQNIYQQ